jgi:hypothetical protein
VKKPRSSDGAYLIGGGVEELGFIEEVLYADPENAQAISHTTRKVYRRGLGEVTRGAAHLTDA